MTLGNIYLIIPILFGIGLFICEKNNLQVFWPNEPKENFFGMPGTIFCELFLNPMRQYLGDPISKLSNHSIFPLAMVNVFIMAMESSIPGANGLVTYYGFMGVISSCCISLAVALIWVPAWIISENRKENSPNLSNPKDVTLNPKRVKQICLGILSMLPLLVGMTVFNDQDRLNALAVSFVFSFPLVALFWIWYPKGVNPNSVNQNAYEFASKFALILFGISFYEWFLVLIYSIDNNFELLIDAITQYISGTIFFSTRYMIVDTWALYAASAYWVFLAENAKFNRKFGEFLVQSILCGPGGALALYAYYRYDGMIEKNTNQSSLGGLRYMNSDERKPLLS